MAGLDLDRFLALPRVSGLALSPDGRRLVTSVATVAPDGKKFVTALWEVDPEGTREPIRLTRSAPGESNPRFLPDGALLFTTKRPDPETKPDDKDDERSRLWLLSMEGHEARPVVDVPSGVDSVAVASEAGTIAIAADAFPGTETPEQDKELHKARKDAGVGAQLFEDLPIRFWDHYLGPRARRLFVADAPADRHAGTVGPLREVTAGENRALHEVSFDVTPDGSTIVSGWRRVDELTNPCVDLVAFDAASGERRVLAAGDANHSGVRCAPDGRLVASVRSEHGTRTSVGRQALLLVTLDGTAEPRDLTPDFDLRPEGVAWSPDSKAVFFTADEDGFAPVFRVEVADGTITRLAADGAYSDLQPSPDGRRVFALRSTMAGPPEVVVLDALAPDQRPATIPTPGVPLEVPGRIERVTATAGDGTPVRSWLVLPNDASPNTPAPLVVFIHGGPIGSWNAWSWRWNPHLLAERGYAVLLPDPAISTGYGQAFVDRGRARWGAEPFTDLMAAVDAAVGRADIDETRTAAMGGSFGGYMANWVAGHTDRFRCIITHASLWALDQFHGTTDSAVHWEREFGDPYEDPSAYVENSPRRFVTDISTPMLVIHGERDHRVPIGEGLRLFTDLRRNGVDAKFLYFPDENHWILKPQNARVWYETVFAFLDQHVLGKDWQRPAKL